MELPNRDVIESGDIVIKRTPRILTPEEKGDLIIKQVPRTLFAELQQTLVDPDIKIEQSEEVVEQDEEGFLEHGKEPETSNENSIWTQQELPQVDEDEPYSPKVQTLVQNPKDVPKSVRTKEAIKDRTLKEVADRVRASKEENIERIKRTKDWRASQENSDLTKTPRAKDWKASQFESTRAIEKEPEIPKTVDLEQHHLKIDKIAKKLATQSDVDSLAKNEMAEIVNMVKQVKSNINQMVKDESFDVADIKVKEPIKLFHEWYEAAVKAHVYQPEVFALATANLKGSPSCRMMTLKEYNKNGFRFLVNSESRKGYELRVNPKCAMTFNWRELKRSIRIEGMITKLSMVDVNKYFKSLPYDSQVIKMASKQSYPIPCRNYLLNRCNHIKSQFPATDQIQLPQHWVAYRLKPTSIEFWQGRQDGIHDRIRFRKPYVYEEPDEKLVLSGEDGWFYERIAP